MLTLRWVTALRPAQLGEARGMDAIEHGEVAYALGTASLRLQRPSVNSSPVSTRGSHNPLDDAPGIHHGRR